MQLVRSLLDMQAWCLWLAKRGSLISFMRLRQTLHAMLLQREWSESKCTTQFHSRRAFSLVLKVKLYFKHCVGIQFFWNHLFLESMFVKIEIDLFPMSWFHVCLLKSNDKCQIQLKFLQSNNKCQIQLKASYFWVLKKSLPCTLVTPPHPEASAEVDDVLPSFFASFLFLSRFAFQCAWKASEIVFFNVSTCASIQSL